MNDIAKLEHIISLVKQYEAEVSRSKEAYRLSMTLYNERLFWSREAGKNPVEDMPKQPITIEENCSDYLKRIEATLSIPKDLT